MIQQPEICQPTTNSSRCQFRFSNRKRCRTSIFDPSVPFCAHHAKLQRIEATATELTINLTEFKSAAALNDFLSRLLLLLAQNKISPRRAAVLAYITNQLLRTVTVIQHESAQAAEVQGIDMTGAPRPIRNLPPQDVVRPYAPDQYQYSQFLAARRREPENV
jgi:hypothetical protein